jgi:protein translocase SecG subunit
MQFMTTLILVVQLLSALTMIGLVLVQHGKGADMGASFGSGASGSLFGATGSANFLSRTTALCATIFFVCTLALAYLSNADGRGQSPCSTAARLCAGRRRGPDPLGELRAGQGLSQAKGTLERVPATLGDNPAFRVRIYVYAASHSPQSAWVVCIAKTERLMHARGPCRLV